MLIQELIRRRKTPIDSGINTQEKKSYQGVLQKLLQNSYIISSSIYSFLGGRAVKVGPANRNPFARNDNVQKQLIKNWIFRVSRQPFPTKWASMSPKIVEICDFQVVAATLPWASVSDPVQLKQLIFYWPGISSKFLKTSINSLLFFWTDLIELT